MPKTQATTPAEYLDALPEDRKKALSEVRKTIRKNLQKGFVETINWGMITYEVPLKIQPKTFNGQPLMMAAIASQKGHMGIYLMCAYSDPALKKKIETGFKTRGLKLNMGKSCIRFKKLDELPLDVIGQVIKSVTLNKFIGQCQK